MILYLFFILLLKLSKCQISHFDIFTYQGISGSACTRVSSNSPGSNRVLGCSSDYFSSRGILYNISSNANLETFLSSSTPKNKYVVLLSISISSNVVLNSLGSSEKLSGVILIPDSSRPTLYSPDSKSPSIGPSSSNDSRLYLWNPNGLLILDKMYAFPIFEIRSFNSTAATSLLEATRHNFDNGYSKFPLFSMEMQSNMWSGNSNAATCLKRGFCTPIGGLSVWSTFSSDLQASNSKPIILVTTRFDANSLVHDFSYGASARASAVVLLVLADALSQASIQNLPKSILFTLFDAENWGAAGSSRFVKDIMSEFQCVSSTSGVCPYDSPACGNPCVQDLDFQRINFNSIESIIEFDIGGMLYNSSLATNLFIHADQIDKEVSALVSLFVSSVSNISYSPAFNQTYNNKLPPSSAISFLKEKNIPTIFISDYQYEFSNPYYNSEFDDGADWNETQVSSLCRVADSAAKTLYALASSTENQIPDTITANCTKILQYLDCLTRNFSCSLMQQFVPNQSLPTTVNSYSSTFSFSKKLAIPYVPYFLHRVLFSITGSKSNSCSNDRECKKSQFCIQSQCITSLTRFHDAYGTGIEMDYGSGTFQVSDPESNSSWVESTWDYTRIRIFQQTSQVIQILEFCASLTINIVVYLSIKYFSF